MLRRAAVALPLLAVLLAGCVGEESLAPPQAPLPSSVASLSLTSGQYLVTPASGVDLEAAATKVRALPGVQSATVTEGTLDVQFTGAATPDQHHAALLLLAPLGEVVEGV